MTPRLTVLDAESVATALSWVDAVAALRQALADGLDPESEPGRGSLRLPQGEILMMPSGGEKWAGVKLVSVVPTNPVHALPRIQGVYALFDGSTLTPAAVLDGAALTAVRTPAVSALGVDLVAPADATRLVVFGTGPQAYGHVHALRAVRPISSVTVIGRNPDHTRDFVARMAADGVEVTAGSNAAVAEADLVACCTTATTPLFDGSALAARAVVVACGSHSPSAREVDSATVGRGPVLVEARSVALAEAGDVVLAMNERPPGAVTLVTMADLVTSGTGDRPTLIKTVGMGWQDLIMAAAVFRAVSAGATSGAPDTSMAVTR